MEHEVFVPFPADTVRRALFEPARIARCLPGFQPDDSEDGEAPDPLAGRLRVRISGTTITYRGLLVVADRDGVLEVVGEGTEARGSGSANLVMSVATRSAEGGTTLRCSGTLRSEGRLAGFDDETATAAAVRLLDRFGAALASDLESHPLAGADEAAADGSADGREAGASPTGKVFEAEIPPPSLDPLADDLDGLDALAGSGGVDDVGDLDDVDEPPAEAAHARRTMIGRSTEEVDHAPPRGRYAPVPAPESGPQAVALRWAAPAAALVIASVVVVGRRVLRRRGR